jgi:hypothetical protein
MTERPRFEKNARSTPSSNYTEDCAIARDRISCCALPGSSGNETEKKPLRNRVRRQLDVKESSVSQLRTRQTVLR